MLQVTWDLPGEWIYQSITFHLDMYWQNQFSKKGRIDLLCEVELANELTNGKLKRKWSLTFNESIFGWIVSGWVQLLSKQIADRVLQTILSGGSLIWTVTVDDLLLARSPRSNEEEIVEYHFDKTTSTQPDGRFSVSLPFKTNIGTLCECKTKANKQFFGLERKLKQDVALYTQYWDFIKKFRDKGWSSTFQRKKLLFTPPLRSKG